MCCYELTERRRFRHGGPRVFFALSSAIPAAIRLDLNVGTTMIIWDKFVIRHMPFGNSVIS